MLVHVVLPNDIDDPATPSGGNTYDREVCDGLAAAGWTVREHAAAGTWPEPTAASRAGLAGILADVPDGALVLLDGLIASVVPAVLREHARRLRLVVLVHLPLDDERECEALLTARAIITTSDWTRRRLIESYALPGDRVHTAPPGVRPAPLAPGSGAGTALLCVAAVTPHKGHDRLAEALAEVADVPWHCVCVGSLDRDPAFVDRLRRQLAADGIQDRVVLAGPRTGAELSAAYAGADLLLLASHGETYGMVVTEALARGTPVLATAVGGVPEALGRAPDGSVPGLLVDAGGLAHGLRRWLGAPELRQALRRSAASRRTTLAGWADTCARVSTVLTEVAA
ncbi:glycosyltransferase family 4 protein [Dactylosporangium aurantiacum]|uniref:Glycosyltransferase family 4 protein n=1 Tax=Dactylosporangium aurantiacum TaxID=35754 RepID=A0A9Q9I906_9ACTN|nr:glycosyltransferase family 4 protein [Dactylosporangium aurantiacum]MDG6105088.1 glycosyltransferase family 4 protein [Dactylosporangium aurantiacum]UWZ51617.1 glycosyltransferase family 4 protein [Dactylosporangium aurantiacum]